MAMPIRNQSLEASNTISVPQKKQAPYVPAYASPVSAAEQQERLAMLERIPQNASAALARLTTTNYQVDRSVHEAILAPPDCWHEEADIPVFTSSDNLKVYLGTLREPLETAEALTRIRELSTGTALTARIVLGLWNIRRSSQQFTKNGSVPIRIEEVLEWRGIKKRSYLAHPDSADDTKRYTHGYAAIHKDRVLKDLDLLSSCCIRGRVNCTFKGKKKELLEAHARQMGGSEQSTIRRWRKTNPAGYFGVAPSSLADCLIIVEGAFDRLALLAAGMDPPDVLALIGTALQVETLPLQVQSVVLALDGDESGQKANQKLAADVQAVGLAATLCPVPADGQGKDWSERWRRKPVYGDDVTYCVFEAWSSAGNHVRV